MQELNISDEEAKEREYLWLRPRCGSWRSLVYHFARTLSVWGLVCASVWARGRSVRRRSSRSRREPPSGGRWGNRWGRETGGSLTRLLLWEIFSRSWQRVRVLAPARCTWWKHGWCTICKMLQKRVRSFGLGLPVRRWSVASCSYVEVSNAVDQLLPKISVLV